MTESKAKSDALVFFGATGDLAYKKIYPALQSMARRGKLDFPIVGVAKSGIGLEQLIERAKASCQEHGGGVDPEAFPILAKQLTIAANATAPVPISSQLRLATAVVVPRDGRKQARRMRRAWLLSRRRP